MEQKLKQWIPTILGASVDMDNKHVCQSPDIIRSWAQYLGAPEDTFTFQDATDIKPKNESFERAWIKDINPGDIVVISRNATMPYGDCLVVTSVNKGIVMGVGAMPHGNTYVAMEHGYQQHRVDRVYRFQPFSRQDLSDMLCDTLTTETDTDEDGHSHHVVSYDSIQNAVDKIADLYLEKSS